MEGPWDNGSPKLESRVSQVADLKVWSFRAHKPSLREYKQLCSPPGKGSLEGMSQAKVPHLQLLKSRNPASFLPEAETLDPRTFLSVPLVNLEGTLPSPRSKPAKSQTIKSSGSKPAKSQTLRSSGRTAKESRNIWSTAAGQDQGAGFEVFLLFFPGGLPRQPWLCSSGSEKS